MVRYALHYDRPIEQSYNLATFIGASEDRDAMLPSSRRNLAGTITGCRRTTSISS